MNIEVKCFATLSKYTPQGGILEIEDRDIRVLDVIKRLGIDKKMVKVVFVNGKHADFHAVIREGDRIGIFPAVGGG